MFFKSLKHRFNTKEKNLLQADTLLSECQHLAGIINSTTDEKEFYHSYDRLISVLAELKTYEGIIPFSNSPSQDLDFVLKSKESAIKQFEKRKSISPLYIPDADPYFRDASNLFVERGKGSIGMLQRHFNIYFNRAARIMDQLEEAGIVGPEEGTSPRKVLVDRMELELLLKDATIQCVGNIPAPLHETATQDHYKLYNNQFDYMAGIDFEHYCADLLQHNRFYNVEVTQGSGDHGIDILAEKDDITYAIQCKCYSSNIGNAAVQQAHTGKSLYHKDIAVVLTNQYFTSQATEEAKELGVKLWDRDKLLDMANNKKYFQA